MIWRRGQQTRHTVRPEPCLSQARRGKAIALAHPHALASDAACLKTVGRYPVVPFSEDIALWFKCLKAGDKFDNLPEPLYGILAYHQREFLTAARLQEGLERVSHLGAEALHRLEGPTWRQIYPLCPAANAHRPQ